MIRGKKGTKVRLLIIPADAADPSKRKTVELVRDEIKLKDQEARADIIIKKDADGEPGETRLDHPALVLRRHGSSIRRARPRMCSLLLKRLQKGKHRRPCGRSAA